MKVYKSYKVDEPLKGDFAIQIWGNVTEQLISVDKSEIGRLEKYLLLHNPEHIIGWTTSNGSLDRNCVVDKDNIKESINNLLKEKSNGSI
jgi:hypothetical protein